MTDTSDIPLWAALLTSIFVLAGASLAMIGSVGLWRMKSFYARVHAPTLGSTLGVGSILIASIIYFTVLKTRPAVHEILIALFVTVTTPVTLLLLVRAALHRDRARGSSEVPGAITFINGTIRMIDEKTPLGTPDQPEEKR